MESNHQTFLLSYFLDTVLFFQLCSFHKMSECDGLSLRNYKLVGTTSLHLSKVDAFHISLSKLLEIFLSATSIIILSKEIWISRISLSIGSMATQIHTYSLSTLSKVSSTMNFFYCLSFFRSIFFGLYF
jgi:hypothetical protein